jgi:DNA-binding NtrC family response regulator
MLFSLGSISRKEAKVYASGVILIFGHDAMLLETRCKVLESAGFLVWTASDAEDAVEVLAEEPVDLFMLCQTLCNEECEAILRSAHTLRPDMTNIVLCIDSYKESSDHRDLLFHYFLDPRSLIALIQREIHAKTTMPLIH